MEGLGDLCYSFPLTVLVKSLILSTPSPPPSSMENMLITRTDTQDTYNLASCPGLTLRTQLQNKSKSRSSIECKEASNTDF